MSEERESKKFWYADFGAIRVIEEEGLRCDEEGAWWFPQLGWTLFEGKQIFTDRKDAVSKIVEACNFHIAEYNEAYELYKTEEKTQKF